MIWTLTTYKKGVLGRGGLWGNHTPNKTDLEADTVEDGLHIILGGPLIETAHI